MHAEITIQKLRGCLWALRKVKVSVASSNHLLKYYTCVLRPVLEFAAPTLHVALRLSL